MSDFCRQCSVYHFTEDFGDLAGLSTAADTAAQLYASALCEGCGSVQVDHTGSCISSDCLIDHSTGAPRDD